MKVEVRYLSYSGNTKKIADAIGVGARVPADDMAIKLSGNVDILFLGCAVYGFNIDPEVEEFINNLKNVKKVAIFSTSAICSKLAYKRVTKLLDAKGIAYYKEHFNTKGNFKFLHKTRPNNTDEVLAKGFARRIMKEGI